jgi:hypothetical protein
MGRGPSGRGPRGKLGPWPPAGGAGELSLQPTPRTVAAGKDGAPEGPWPPATGPPGAAERHPFAGQRPLPRLVCRKATSCAKIVLPNPAAGAFGVGRHRGLESPRLAGPWGESPRPAASGQARAVAAGGWAG